ncbi:MAG: EAL domain-containing protein [Gammaproteobacteria bacterium]
MSSTFPNLSPADEARRLEALVGFDILDTPPERAFDEVVVLAAHLCNAPISTITLVDEHRQWFKARIGLDVDHTARDIAFCAHAILQNAPMIIPDARLDPRFAANPLVLHAPHIVFYAGFPLVSAHGCVVGTLTVMDHVPRTLAENQLFAMKVLSRQVVAQFELRSSLRLLTKAQMDMTQAALELEARVEERTRELARASAAQAYAERLYRSLWETTTDAAVILDTQNVIQYANPSTTFIFGFPTEQLVGNPLSMLQPERLRMAHQEGMKRYLDTGHKRLDWRASETVGMRVDGTEVPIEIAFSEFMLDGRRLFVGFIRDITERKRAAAELAHHLTHDLVTNLPRFAAIEEHLRSAMITAAAHGDRILVLYVDLDYFHSVNETRGRSIGDDVLRTVGERLSAVVASNGTVGHVAANEFALIQVDNENCKHDQIGLAETIRGIVAEPMVIAGHQIYVTCSVGVSCFPDNATAPLELLRQAEAAMVRAKRDGRNAVSVFSNEQNEELQIRLALGSRLRSAISEGQLLLHYQPQISGLNWQIVGFEALVRWQDPDLGFVMPRRFIQAAEELGLIVDLGRFVLNETCRQASAWLQAGVGDFSIAVNISPLHLQRQAFVDDVRSALVKYGVPPHCIELELTESVMMENVERMIRTMQALKSLGVRLSLDDFGTGYSNLNYLRRFPINCLKIDQSFVRDVTSDASSAGICRAVITLGHQLGMQVMAEGVETSAQVGYLKRNECDLFQGFYFGTPLVPEKALELLRQRYIAHDDIGKEEQHVQTLLLVDDEANVLNALSRALRRSEYRILVALSGEEALDILAREDVHVIMSDQRMPGLSGTELLSKVKEMYPDTVRIVLSGYTDLGAITEAINQGAIYKFLTKPWEDEELRRQIQDAFRMHRLHATGRAPG